MRDQPAAPSPPDVEELARRRSEARRAGDYAAADALRDEIMAAGWRVVDHGLDHRLEPLHPPDVAVDGITRHGASGTVPSRFDEPDSAAGTVVLVAGRDASALERSVAALGAPGHDAAQLIVVADAPGPATEQALAALPAAADVVRLASPAPLATAWNSGIRRAVGSTVVLLDRHVALTGDPVPAAAAALADEGVAIVGRTGLVSRDVRHWQPTDEAEVDAVDADALCFRRSDGVARGPLEERFWSARLLAVWWSLVMRDEGPDSRPRRAIALDLPTERPPEDSPAATPREPPSAGRDRAARRDFYRIVDRFGRRYDLLREPVRPTAAPGRSRER